MRCATCGVEFYAAHVCPMTTTVSPIPAGFAGLPFTAQPTVEVASVIDCPYCEQRHGRRYACDALLAAAKNASPTPE